MQERKYCKVKIIRLIASFYFMLLFVEEKYIRTNLY
jgi:hypothetical protein